MVRRFADAGNRGVIQRIHCGRSIEQVPLFVRWSTRLQPIGVFNAKDNGTLKSRRAIRRERLVKRFEVRHVSLRVYTRQRPMPKDVCEHGFEVVLFPGTAGVSPAVVGRDLFRSSAGETPAVPGKSTTTGPKIVTRSALVLACS